MVKEATYQIHTISTQEKGFLLRLQLKNAAEDVVFDSLIFRNRIIKTLEVQPIGRLVYIQTYVPLLSAKHKTYLIPRSKQRDGIYFTSNKKSYFYPIQFKIKSI